MIMIDYSNGPNVITRVLNWGRGRQRIRTREMTLKMKGSHNQRNEGRLLKLEKARDFPIEPP